jgi:flagellar assembly protein FliH
MTSPAPRKFAFETEFDPVGGIAYEPPRPKTFTEAEVEQLTAAAYQEGEGSAVARAEAAAAAALRDLADAARLALSTLTQVAHEHRAGAAELALACGRKIADAAIDQFPHAPAAAALDALSREIEQAPRLILRTRPDLLERIAAAVQATADNIGFSGQITAKADPALPAAAFQLDWGDGRAAFDPQATAAMVEEALAAALAADGLHAEPLIPASEGFM